MLPLFMIIGGYISSVFFFYKVKFWWYRIFIIIRLFRFAFFTHLYTGDLENIFFHGAVIANEKLIIKGWELYNIWDLLEDIAYDIIFYHLYIRKKIFTFNIRAFLQQSVKDLQFLTKDPKILMLCLGFIIIMTYGLYSFIEIMLKDSSIFIELLRDFINSRNEDYEKYT